MKEFTFIEIANWRAYEKVRLKGRYNMFDPQARIASRLTPEAYSFVMNNYTALAKAVLKDAEQ